MKIDSFDINLSAASDVYRQTRTTTREQWIFPQLLNQQIERRTGPGMLDFPTLQLTEQPVRLQSGTGEQTVQLSQQFISELEKLRQMLNTVIDRLNSSGFCNCYLSGMNIGNISLFPVSSGLITPVEYQYVREVETSQYERRSSRFLADGRVETADGRQIDFTFETHLAKEHFRQEMFAQKEEGFMLLDPLIINFEGAAPQIGNSRIDFDLNLDGTDDQLPVLMPGSGYLSLDKNRDGIINNGSELFGPSTGQGFEELGQYDSDQNNWIDENDPIFDELTLWEGSENGGMQLTRIKDAGIGAIYLANVQSPFDLSDESDRFTGRIRSSGVVLNEDGTAGGIQQVDWVV